MGPLPTVAFCQADDDRNNHQNKEEKEEAECKKEDTASALTLDNNSSPNPKRSSEALCQPLRSKTLTSQFSLEKPCESWSRALSSWGLGGSGGGVCMGCSCFFHSLSQKPSRSSGMIANPLNLHPERENSSRVAGKKADPDEP